MPTRSIAPVTGRFPTLHHTISHAGLVGGGNTPKSGEISLAHRGALWLDKFLEFGRRVLEVMRQRMEDKVVTISRAKGSLHRISSDDVVDGGGNERLFHFMFVHPAFAG